MSAPDLRAWADHNVAAAFALLIRNPNDGVARSPRRFGGCVAYPTGRRGGFFNPIVVTEPASADDVREAVTWMRDEGSPVSLRIRDDLETRAIRAAAADLGLERNDWVEPAMVMWPLRPAPDPPSGLVIEEGGETSVARFHEAAASGFTDGGPAGLAFMADLFPPAIASDPDIRLFGGFLDGDAVASSVAIRGGPVGGIYSVGTAERARRRGIGTAMTWRAVEAGRAWGCEAATLQASAMGEPVYRAMGFERVAGYALWNRPAPRPARATDAEGEPG
ncbi:MAG TPA: GNAT family N-acetyltransferase [Candidatus Limnocylindrales bacterium]|jgi:GNAT superfamily N-acetyltransferase